ncbi:MAG: cohesin domain-containing protein [Bacteroidia bacterium]|nr:cohesin domain-containing protein [Bacteroidia bacterium]
MGFKLKKQFLILFLSFLLFPFLSNGATLYFSPEKAEYGKGDVFKVDVRLDTAGDSINTCEAKIYFNKNQLEVSDIAEGGSLMTLWAKGPFYSNAEGTVVLVGGVPGGFKGDGKIISIIFRAIGPGSTVVSFQDDSKVLLNDGKGTLAGLIKKDAIFEIFSSKAQPSDEWQKEIEKDKTLPEPFEMKIGQDPTIFEGKYFIVFSAMDKQTGVAYYQIKEGDSEWKTGESPYLLDNQGLKEKILVKAVDKAGNERTEELSPAKSKLFYVGILTFLIITFWLIYFFFKKFKFKNS